MYASQVDQRTMNKYTRRTIVGTSLLTLDEDEGDLSCYAAIISRCIGEDRRSNRAQLMLVYNTRIGVQTPQYHDLKAALAS